MLTVVITRHPGCLEAGRKLAARAAAYGGCSGETATRLGDAVDLLLKAFAERAVAGERVELGVDGLPQTVRVSVRCSGAASLAAVVTDDVRARLQVLVDAVEVSPEPAGGVCRLSSHVTAL